MSNENAALKPRKRGNVKDWCEPQHRTASITPPAERDKPRKSR
jgi:hypothetical protein